MLKTKKILHIVAALVLILILWMAFALVQGLFQRNQSNHEMFIPADAESVLKIDGEEIIYLFTSDIILQNRTDGGIGKLIDFGDESEPLGIDFRSAVYVFNFKQDNERFTGILLNVIDETQFKAGMKSRKSVGSEYAVKDGVGMILFHLAELDQRTLDHSNLRRIASKILERKTGFDLTKLSSKRENSKLSYWTKKYTSSDGSIELNDIRLSLFLEGNKLELIGSSEIKSSLSTNYSALKREDLSIRMAIVPDAINERWKKYTTELGLPLPALTSISGNYHYIEPSGIAEPKFLPHFDGIYSFVDTLPIQVPLYVLNAKGMISNVTKSAFKLGEKTIYYKQIDVKTIYLGQTKFTGSEQETSTLFELSGSLKQILEIRNGGMMMRFLSLSSEYNATEKFLKNIKKSNFSMKKSSGNMVSMNGQIEFQKGKSGVHEIMQFLLVEMGLVN